MADDIVTRLWQYAPEAPPSPQETRSLLNDAAAEIAWLRAVVAEQRAEIQRLEAVNRG